MYPFSYSGTKLMLVDANEQKWFNISKFHWNKIHTSGKTICVCLYSLLKVTSVLFHYNLLEYLLHCYDSASIHKWSFCYILSHLPLHNHNLACFCDSCSEKIIHTEDKNILKAFQKQIIYWSFIYIIFIILTYNYHF